MATARRDVAVGLFRDPRQARDAIGELKDRGFRSDDISLLMQDRGDAREMAEQTGTHAPEGAATGAVAGGVLGGLAGWLAGIGALAIPGAGPFIAAGALGATLGGAALGAGVGAIAGALIGMGIPEDEAKYYEQEVRGGRTLVVVRDGNRRDEADEILHRHGAYDVEHRDRFPDGAARESRESREGREGREAPRPMGVPTDAEWSAVSPMYRERHEQRVGAPVARWEDEEQAYRYGWEERKRPEYQGRRFETAEPDLRRNWEAGHRETPWDRAREQVRETFEG